jgi:hypothetical protein
MYDGRNRGVRHSLLASYLSRWPFRRERILGRFGFFAVAGWLACMLPVFHATKWVCAVS